MSLPEPVDLAELMSSEPPDAEWMVEPLLLRGKITGIVAKRGDGKSLLALDVVAARAVGRPTLLQEKTEPVHVVYLDQEMGPDDLYDRLAELGWLPGEPDFGSLVEHLHYYQLVDLPTLDTEAGGKALEEIVASHNAELVVIDTVSRVISGKENDAEPFLGLFRHTETRLKRRGVTVARLDHLGKDADRGSRGHSAKEDSLDVVWKLVDHKTSVTLEKKKGRQAGIPPQILIHRDTVDSHLEHTMKPQVAPEWLTDTAFLLDQAGITADAGVNETERALKAIGQGKRRSDISQIVKFRKGRASQVGSRLPDSS